MVSSTERLTRAAIRALLLGVAAVALMAASGCGGSEGSKPGYCAGRDELRQSVEDLPGVVAKGGLSELQVQLLTVRTNATALAEDAKSDFPAETSALTSSVDALSAAVKALPDGPSAAEIATLAFDISAVVRDARSLSDAITSACD